MAQVAFGRAALAKMAQLDEAHPLAEVLIRDGAAVLGRHPLIGPSVSGKKDRRRLVISAGKTGYIALYRYYQARNIVLVLAVRHQREAGYAE